MGKLIYSEFVNFQIVREDSVVDEMHLKILIKIYFIIFTWGWIMVPDLLQIVLCVQGRYFFTESVYWVYFLRATLNSPALSHENFERH